jgi:hypothetical protein
VLLGSERRRSRQLRDFDGSAEAGSRVLLYEQLEEILGEIWRQEAWAETEDRIDALLQNIRAATR